MLDDAEHSRWKSRELQLGLETAFGDSLDACRDTIEEIGSTLRSLQDGLCCFDEIENLCPKVSPRVYEKFVAEIDHHLDYCSMSL